MYVYVCTYQVEGILNKLVHCTDIYTDTYKMGKFTTYVVKTWLLVACITAVTTITTTEAQLSSNIIQLNSRNWKDLGKFLFVIPNPFELTIF